MKNVNRLSYWHSRIIKKLTLKLMVPEYNSEFIENRFGLFDSLFCKGQITLSRVRSFGV